MKNKNMTDNQIEKMASLFEMSDEELLEYDNDPMHDLEREAMKYLSS